VTPRVTLDRVTDEPSPRDLKQLARSVAMSGVLRDRDRLELQAVHHSAGSTFSFDAELAEVSDDTFTETEVEIDVHRGTGFIQASVILRR
jgi:hypothetical protein